MEIHIGLIFAGHKNPKSIWKMPFNIMFLKKNYYLIYFKNFGRFDFT